MSKWKKKHCRTFYSSDNVMFCSGWILLFREYCIFQFFCSSPDWQFLLMRMLHFFQILKLVIKRFPCLLPFLKRNKCTIFAISTAKSINISGIFFLGHSNPYHCYNDVSLLKRCRTPMPHKFSKIIQNLPVFREVLLHPFCITAYTIFTVAHLF